MRNERDEKRNSRHHNPKPDTEWSPAYFCAMGKIAVIIPIVPQLEIKKERQNYRIIRIFYCCMNDWLESNEWAILSSFRAAILSTGRLERAKCRFKESDAAIERIESKKNLVFRCRLLRDRPWWFMHHWRSTIFYTLA